MANIEALVTDLSAEHDALDCRIAGLDPAVWATPTPAEGWTIGDQIQHLWFYDRKARQALTDPDGFVASIDEVQGPAGEPKALLDCWRHDRADLTEAIRARDQATRVPWYGPAMSVASFTTARLMETWAHGTDVGDALGLPPVQSERLRHVCHIGIAARPYAFSVHGKQDPGDPIRVEVTDPEASWGPEDATDRVTGPALDLALVVTQRRHPADTSLAVTGPTAQAWIQVAQAFAGPAGAGRQPARP
ncbi:MAG: TIGR03084 family protein [Acidimicrobiaceae bacterium]|nr:TIGR03084 family protein [Acidimicrobiaceae bacterium]